MKRLLKNWLSISKNRQKRYYLTCILLFNLFVVNFAQVVNYVNNGGFETLNQPYTSYNGVKYWGPIDTNNYCYFAYSTSPSFSITMAPYISTGFQYPRTGNNLVLTSFYCDASVCTYTWSRGYPRNRLKQNLKPNTAYCAKYYVVNTNNCTHATDGYGVYFGDSSIDTIKYCVTPLIYLTPQVENPSGNIITDTLSWIPITGTFVAVGDEKYMVLGNFKSNSSTNTLLINPTFSPAIYTDIYVDDVSLIELNLPADAGADKSIVPGDSVFIGRQPDVGIDEACMWYKLPNISVPFDTVAGLWVKPTTASTYIVRQNICGNVKWDTVVVNMNLVGLEKLKWISENLSVYPVPATEKIELRIENENLSVGFNFFKILNGQGQLIKEGEVNEKENKIEIEIGDLNEGVYSIHLISTRDGTFSKRFVVGK